MVQYFLTNYAAELVTIIVYIIFGCVGCLVGTVYKKVCNDETKQDVAKTVVMFVEQVYKTLHGEDKLAKALETVQSLLAKKGISYDEDEMKVLIEAAVAEFNHAFETAEVTEVTNAVGFDTTTGTSETAYTDTTE